MIDLAVIATTFALILPAELPDKTFIATLVLATRFRHLWVWIGVAAAFAVQVAIAVLAGGLLALLPQRIVLGATFLLFAAGAFVMIRGGLASRASELKAQQEEADEVESRASGEATTTALRTVLVSFVVLFTAEWGDLSQLLTAGLAARSGQPLSVFIGSWLAFSQPYFWRAPYAHYTADWQPEQVVLQLRREQYEGVPAEEIMPAVMALRNVVLQMVATIRAVKPARPNDKTLLRPAELRFALVDPA